MPHRSASPTRLRAPSIAIGRGTLAMLAALLVTALVPSSTEGREKLSRPRKAEEVATPAVSPPRLLGELGGAERVLLPYPVNGWDEPEFYGHLLQIVAGVAPVTILVGDDAHELSAATEVAMAGVAPDRVRFLRAPLDTVWIRDYGPLFQLTDDGRLGMLDAEYSIDRGEDDQLPGRLAKRWGWPVAPVPLDLDGGHIITDGDGRCVLTETLLETNEERFEGRDVEEVVRTALGETVGCRSVTFVPALVDELTGHVDVFAMFTGARQVVVGRYDPEEDPENASILDEAAARLWEDGFEVHRIPMPGSDGRRVFRTYTNGLFVNRLLIVPVYRDEPTREAEALDLLRQLLPSREVVPIAADDIIELHGAVHCGSMVVPVRPEEDPATAPHRTVALPLAPPR